jgi:hypothetical protein
MILKSSFFEVIADSRIGQIVFPDGNKTMFLVTKRQALDIAEGQLGVGLFEDEYKIIVQQIIASNLIEKNSELENISRELQGSLDELKRKVENLFKE